MEQTLVLIKPDALQRALVGRIVSRFEEKGLKLVGAKLVQMTDAMLDTHYAHLSHLPFFPQIKRFMASSPVLAMCWEGVDAVDTVRRLCGKTKAREADPGTIRGDLGMSVQANLVHASESLDAASTEVRTFFADQELFSYDWITLPVIYSPDERAE